VLFQASWIEKLHCCLMGKGTKSKIVKRDEDDICIKVIIVILVLVFYIL
jgi:hypothetical protein